jgi:hypothetical protein
MNALIKIYSNDETKFLTGISTNLYTYAASVTAGFKWAPLTMPKMLTINITTKPKPNIMLRWDGGDLPSDKSTQPMHPRKINMAVAIVSERPTVNNCNIFEFMLKKELEN